MATVTVPAKVFAELSFTTPVFCPVFEGPAIVSPPDPLMVAVMLRVSKDELPLAAAPIAPSTELPFTLMPPPTINVELSPLLPA